MSLIKETKKALLALFPEQAEAEEAAETTEIEEEPVAMEEPELDADEAAPAEEEKEVSQDKEASAEDKTAVEEAPVTSGVIDKDYKSTGVHLDVLATPDQVVEAARILDEAGFYLEAITGVDWINEDEMEVIYDYNHTGGELCKVMVRARISRSNPEIPTVSEVFPGANWHERETHDFLGIKFQGHPYLVPLLLPEDADFHPLLKDFTP